MVRTYKPTGKPRGRPRKDGKPPRKGGYIKDPKRKAPKKQGEAASAWRVAAATEPLPPTDYLAECFRREGDVLIWKERPASHFEGWAKRSDAMERFNSERPGKVAGFPSKNRVFVACRGKNYTISRIVTAMKEAGL